MTSFSPNKKTAIAFVKFILSPQGERIIGASGQAPVLPGYRATNPLQQQLLSMASSGKYSIYPMFDNFMPSAVLNVATRVLDEVLADQTSPDSAASAIAGAMSNLPQSEQNVNYYLGS